MNIQEVPIESIVVGDRAREELGDLEQLQKSIKRLGVINPICIMEGTYKLVAGFRRYTCCKTLSFKTIPARFYEELSEVEKEILELEENLHKELTWYEQSKLRGRIHTHLQEEHGKAVKGHKGGWGTQETADYLGVSVGTISQDISLVETAKIAPKITEFTSKKQALKSLNKMREMAILTEMARRDTEEGLDQTKSGPYTLYNGDAVKFIKDNIEDETIDLIIFDPPWGIDVDKKGSSRGLRGEKVFYDDSELTSKDLISQIMPELHRVLKANAHMYMFIGIQYLSYYINYLMNLRQVINDDGTTDFKTLDPNRKWRFDVRTIPLIWIKEGGGYTDFEYKFMPKYEPILFCSKGTRRLNYPTDDVFNKRRPLTTERIHPQQKSLELIKDFIKLSSHENEIVFDPMAGSGVTVVAATITGRRSIAIEKSKEAFLKMSNWIKGFDIEKEKEDNET